MPSKGGGRHQAAAGTGVAAMAGAPIATTPSEPTRAPIAFSAAELGGPLRRGFEVDRFNELAGRQEDLTTEESDELYGYRLRRVQARLRRLDRVRRTEYEEAIRDALDDLDGRLQELRRFEEARQRAGLATVHELDHSSRAAAIDRLLELSRRRLPGLVAGSDRPPEQPAGSTRLRTVAFRPTPGDVPVYILAPSSIPSDAVARNVDEVAGQGAQVRLVHEASEIPRDAERLPLVLNWGGSEALPGDLVALNRPEAVRISSDQVESLRRLGQLAPRTVARPDDTGLLGTERMVAKRRHGTRGSGKAVIWSDAGWGERVHYDLFQEFIPERREYRVSVLSGRVVSAYLKRAPEGTSPEELRPQWSFEQTHVLPAAVVASAREAARRIGLDYAGVDVVEDLHTGRVLCLEANAAPGMSAETLRSLYAQIQQTVRGRTARAS